jgi:hypothetical protein
MRQQAINITYPETDNLFEYKEPEPHTILKLNAMTMVTRLNVN